MSKTKNEHNEKTTGISRAEYEQAHNSLINKNGNSYIALNKARRAALIKAGVSLTFPQVKMSPQKKLVKTVPLNPPRFAHNRL